MLVVVAHRGEERLQAREVGDVGGKLAAVLPWGASSENTAVAGDVIALVQFRGEIVDVNDVARDGGLAADLRDGHACGTSDPSVDGDLAVCLAIGHRDFAGDLDRPGDAVRRIFRPIIAQLDRA